MFWEAVLMNWDLAVVALIPTAIVVGTLTYIYLTDDSVYDTNDHNRF